METAEKRTLQIDAEASQMLERLRTAVGGTYSELASSAIKAGLPLISKERFDRLKATMRAC